MPSLVRTKLNFFYCAWICFGFICPSNIVLEVLFFFLGFLWQALVMPWCLVLFYIFIKKRVFFFHISHANQICNISYENLAQVYFLLEKKSNIFSSNSFLVAIPSIYAFSACESFIRKLYFRIADKTCDQMKNNEKFYDTIWEQKYNFTM